MNRLRLLQEVLQMRFEEAYGRWKKRRLTQAEAADVLGVSERTFRRYIARYEEEEDIRALLDRRISQPSGRRAPVDEIMSLMDMYQSRYKGWNVKHFYSYYKREGAGGAIHGSRIRSRPIIWWPRPLAWAGTESRGSVPL